MKYKDVTFNKIDSNQTAVAIRLNPKIFFKCGIQGPGFGKKIIRAGKRVKIKYGVARPIPNAKNTNKISIGPLDNENPTAVPKKGAEHGVDRSVARAPCAKLPKSVSDFIGFPI